MCKISSDYFRLISQSCSAKYTKSLFCSLRKYRTTFGCPSDFINNEISLRRYTHHTLF